MKTRWLGLMGIAVALSGCQAAPSVHDAWVRLPAVPGRPAAAYAEVKGGATDTAVVRISTPAAGRSEMHLSSNDAAGHMSMTPIDAAALRAGQTASFAPGGMHVMLFDLRDDLRIGGTIPLTFHFRDDEVRPITVDARLVGAGDPAP